MSPPTYPLRRYVVINLCQAPVPSGFSLKKQKYFRIKKIEFTYTSATLQPPVITNKADETT